MDIIKKLIIAFLFIGTVYLSIKSIVDYFGKNGYIIVDFLHEIMTKIYKVLFWALFLIILYWPSLVVVFIRSHMFGLSGLVEFLSISILLICQGVMLLSLFYLMDKSS